MVIGATIGGLAVGLFGRLPIGERFIKLASQSDLLFILPILLLVIFVHELGHLAGGILRGMSFLLLVVGPFQWTRGVSGIRFGWNLNPGMMGGLAAATPDRQRPLLPQLLGLVLGGPLASLFLAVGSFLLGDRLDGRPAALLLMTGLFSLAIFLVTALPFRAGGMQTDGWQLIEISRGGDGVVERQLILEIMGASLTGERPRNWNAEIIDRLENLVSREPLRNIAARILALYYHWDRGEQAQVESLAAWLNEHVAEYPAGFRQAIHVDLALLALDSEAGSEAASPAVIDRHVAAAAGGMVEPARRKLLAAKLAFRDGRLDEARVPIPE
ncbi:MAG: hypothetical protein EBZ36_02545 [Acidobacteria bacterium]|nr:hypothetical protein [Acidobacteriota bacterium]